MKKKCPKYATWHVMKGKFLTLVGFEVNLSFVPKDIWWVDCGATTYISMSLHMIALGADRQVMMKDSSLWVMTKRLQ